MSVQVIFAKTFPVQLVTLLYFMTCLVICNNNIIIYFTHYVSCMRYFHSPKAHENT